MGVGCDGILAYGYDLGGDDQGWKLKNWDRWENSSKDFSWYEPDEDNFGSALEEAAMKVLLASVGFTENDRRAPGYYDRMAEAEKELGVHLVKYQSADYPAWILAAKSMRCSLGICNPVDTTVQLIWNETLRVALMTLGINPAQEEAEWLLASHYSH